MKHIKKSIFLTDDSGFSTTFDILLFLILISISSAALLPSIAANNQVRSVLESKSQENSEDTLFALLNGRVYDFEYITAGDQLDALAGPINNSSMYLHGKKIIAGKELKHRFLSDISSDNAAVQWVIYYNGTRIQLNFIMTDFSTDSKNIISNYFDEKIGDRYNYNFSIVWRSFTSVPIGGDFAIGEQVPDNAYVESAYITIPYHIAIPRKQAEEFLDKNFNESQFGNFSVMFEELKTNATIRNLIELEIANRINDTINDTIDGSIDIIVDENLAPVLDDASTNMIENLNGWLLNSKEPFNQVLNNNINGSLDSVNANNSGTMSDKLKIYLKKAAKEEVMATSGDKISSFSTELADMYVNNAITIAEAKKRIIAEVFSRININRAQATLSLWEKTMV